ncbi:MAG: response regulator [bacterium]|nr:response regulator [bacterium]
MRYRASVFDDDEAIREIVVEILKQRGYEVQDYAAVSTCPLYLEANCGCPVGVACNDVIISDVHMPGLTGLEFIEHQKKNGCKVKHIALMSGAWTEESRQQAENLGCEVFTKPFRVQELVNWLKRCERKLAWRQRKTTEFSVFVPICKEPG